MSPVNFKFNLKPINNMTKLLIIVASFLCIGQVSAQKGKWVSLFDGKSTAGWHTFNKPVSQPTAWIVQDGGLYLDASAKEGRGDLVTNDTYDEFELKFDWKVAKGYNGGVIFVVQEEPKFNATFITGPEFQVIDNVGYPDKLQPGQLAASLYDLIPCPTEYIKPTGEWNTSVIRFKNKKLDFVVNGKKAISITVGSDEWNKKVAESKFGSMCCFAKITKGKIALQDHGGGTWYKNIMIRNL
jgi:hypothetical protein